MSDLSTLLTNLPLEQQAIRSKCFHPSGTFVEFPMEDVETSIPARFEKIVRMYPERLAVKMADRTLTYDQLNRFANRIARAILEKCGYGSEPVALFFEHGIDVIAAILGVLKTGKFYVALNPAVPFERNARMLVDSESRLILTNRSGVEAANRYNPGRIALIDIETIAETVGADDLQLRLPPETRAILVYTSGSTGMPKGVIEPHRNLLHSVMVQTNNRCISAADKLTLLHSLSFGSSKVQLFTALLNGAVLLPFDLRMDGSDQLLRWLEEEELTIYHSPPAAFRQLAQSLADKKQLSKLRMMYLSGVGATRLDLELAQIHFGPHTLLEIGMGSTETNQITLWSAGRNMTYPETGTPAGYAVSGKQILILDEQGCALPPGEMGEIAVKSRYLSDGYWRQPELTAKKFLPDPSGGNERLYLTGDLGLMRPDGFLIHQGRKDLMVKIRGFRVELGEVERALISHPLIKDAGVVAWDRETGEKYLVGYIVVRPQAALSVTELRTFLHNQLPDFMIPSTFMFIESLPLINAKLDRRALPEPDYTRPRLATPYAAARSELEEKLARIWGTVLDIDQVGIHDNFFDLGGHSLMAMRILSATHSAFAVEVSMRQLLDAPTVAGLAEQVELLQTTEAMPDGAVSTRRGPIPAIAKGRAKLPLSYAEEGLWLMEQLQPGLSTWNMQLRWRLRGALDVALLERSLNALIERHEILRTSYDLVNGNPVRVIAAELEVEIPISQLEPSLDTDREIGHIGLDDRIQPFDLTKAPLLRVRITRLNEQDHVLIITQHHIVTDAWSSRIFSRELFALYDAAAKGQPSPLAALPIQYSDYALWDRQSDQEETTATLAYWQEKLMGYAVQEIPTDKRRPLRRTHNGATEEIHLTEALTRALGRLCKEERVTRFMLLVAALKILLGRYTRSSDIIVGSALAGRHRPELENLLGMFVNILPLRTDLSGEPTFRELLRRVRETCLEAYRHQDMPFDRLMQQFNPNRETSRTPFFQVLFDIVNLPRVKHDASGLEIETLMRSDDTARYEVVIRAPQSDGGITIRVDYKTDLFSQSRIAAMLEQYKYLLEQIAANPEGCIDDYSLVTATARQTLPDPRVPLDDKWEGAVHQLFADQAARAPHRIAVKDAQGAWSYERLDAKSNQLANYLCSQGLSKGEVVAIYGTRSANLVLALLSVLKAGGAFLILDPPHPAHRLVESLQLACVRGAIWLDAKAFQSVDCIWEPRNGFRISLAEVDNELRQWPTSAPDLTTGPADLAYVAFTSGTTGEPKGVRGLHGSLTHFLPWVEREFQLRDEDRFGMSCGLVSNLLHREIFTPLVLGAQLCIPSAEPMDNPEEYLLWVGREKITVLHWPPAMTRLLNHSGKRVEWPELRCLFFGGDLVRREQIESLRAWAPQARVIGFYGSTEGQRAVGYFSRDVDEPINCEVLPIGRGIPDVQLLVVNTREQLAGVGEVGEIWVRSPHLAAGYLNDESLSAARFITNPFTQVQGDRIYRTGESGRFLPSGEVEFVARAENQVSIRGYRVELGEIEAVLKSHPGINDVVVTLDEASKENLIAHIVCEQNSKPTTAELRSYLRSQLPRHMIPAAMVFLDRLPLTPTGKVDRAVLPSVDVGSIGRASDFVAPRSDLEKQLADIWSELLKYEQISVYDNFFYVGGHSLIAVQIVSRVRQALGVDLPLRSLFESFTVADMARIIEKQLGESSSDQELAQMLREVEAMTEEEAQKQLAGKSGRSSKGDRHE